MTRKYTKPTLSVPVYISLLLLLVTGCQSNSPERSGALEATTKQASVAGRSYAMGAGAAAPAAPNAEVASDKNKSVTTPQVAMPRKIIYTADVSLVVDDLAPVEAKLTEALKTYNGFVASANVTGGKRGSRSGMWKVRIPIDKFEAFLQQASTLGEVQSSNTQSDDVSEEFYDVTARIKNKKVEEERLIQHLKASTGKLSEILTVEKEISRVREEVERMEGRLRFLANQTDLTTITLTVSEARGYVPESAPTFRNQVGRAFGSSLTTMADFFKGLALVLVGIFPWALLLGLPAFVAYKVYKRRLSK